MTTPAAHSKQAQVQALISAALAAGLRVVEIGNDRGRVYVRTAPLGGSAPLNDPAADWLRDNG